jgi:hypothetical protein
MTVKQHRPNGRVMYAPSMRIMAYKESRLKRNLPSISRKSDRVRSKACMRTRTHAFSLFELQYPSRTHANKQGQICITRTLMGRMQVAVCLHRLAVTAYMPTDEASAAGRTRPAYGRQLRRLVCGLKNLSPRINLCGRYDEINCSLACSDRK